MVEIDRSPQRVGSYELIEPIGRGGMGIVYKARQPGLDRVVALKMILGGGVASDGDRIRFQTEAKAAANLNHPGIVNVYEIGEHNGQPYFTMDYIDGPTLASPDYSRSLNEKSLACVQVGI